MSKKIGIALFVLVILVVAGCGTQLVYNIEEAPIITSVTDVSKTDIAKAIKRAGITLGWQMKDKAEGEIIGTLLLRKHMAKVSIKYTTDYYSIKYLDSKELRYDGTKIHRNYNGWIQNLDRDIQIQLRVL